MGPVWPGYFADPAVLRTNHGYFAYGTDVAPPKEGRAVPVLFSRDLKEWNLRGGSLDLAGFEPNVWAPEVAEKDGRFFMFFSAGGTEGEGHKLRVARASAPEGPFVDRDKILLPNEPFSIDASPFQDPMTGEWWLFFAKDFLDGDFPGTGIAVVRLRDDLLAVSGDPTTVLRPSAEWHLFERNRFWYGRTWDAWYTVEGPFCVFRQERYWLFYSGGLWKGDSYGVDVLVADTVTGPYRRPSASEGPTLLRSRAGLRGPGHNTVTVGPDGRDHVVFHAWDESYTKRQMYIEPLVWTQAGPRLAAG